MESIRLEDDADGVTVRDNGVKKFFCNFLHIYSIVVVTVFVPSLHMHFFL